MLYRHVFDKISTEFRGILRIYQNFAAPRPREISEALFVTGQNSSQVKIFLTWVDSQLPLSARPNS